MPTDSALLVAGAGPAPLDYEVPNAQEIIVLSARAIVDGSGAGSAFLPVVEFISDGDIILTQAITDSTVAAGGSAQVSWFPRVGAAAAAAFTPQSCAAFSATPIGNVLAGQTAITWTNIQTAPGSIFSISGTDATKILVNGYGYYLLATEISFVNNPQTFTSQLLLSNEVEDANGLGTLTYITNAISMKDASVADPKEAQILEGFDYWSGATGYTLPFNVRVFLTLGQTINVQRVGMFLTRLSPTPIV